MSPIVGPVDRAPSYLTTLLTIEKILYDCLDREPNNQSVQDLIHSLDDVKGNLDVVLGEIANLQRQDESRLLYSAAWARLGLEVVAKENRYRNEIFLVAKQLGIELPQPGSWSTSTTLVVNAPPPFLKYLSIGEEQCVDRRLEVSTFWKMLQRDPSIPQRLLAFQVGAGQGKSRLLKRFDQICQWHCKEGHPTLSAYVDFRDRTLTPYELVYEIATTMQLNAEFIGGHLLPCVPSLEILCAEIKKAEPVQPSESKMSIHRSELKDLAITFFRCLYELAPSNMIVLILDTFEQAGETGEWFLEGCLPLLKRLDNVIIVLAGRAGLEMFDLPDNLYFRKTLEPMQYVEDCQRLAEIRWQISLTEQQAKQIIQTYRGDMQSIDTFLKCIRDFPEILSVLGTTEGV